jgi:hypothetical protein
MKEKCGITFWESLWHWSAYTVDQYRVGLNNKKEFQIMVAVPDTDQIKFNWICGFRIRYPDPGRQKWPTKI